MRPETRALVRRLLHDVVAQVRSAQATLDNGRDDDILIEVGGAQEMLIQVARVLSVEMASRKDQAWRS